jgi:outer membrane lipoprotein-sorting protein
MITIENIESAKYQRIKIGKRIWQITNIIDEVSHYEFYLSDGNRSRNVTLNKSELIMYIDGDMIKLGKKDINSMYKFLSIMTAQLNK